MRTATTTSTLAGGAALLMLGGSALAQSAACSSTLTSSHAAPSMAAGFESRLVATGLSMPRGIVFDSQGALLVVEEKVGVVALTLEDSGNGCITMSSKKTVVPNTLLNHGITMSADGTTLYASDPESVFSWKYDAMSQKTTSPSMTLVTNMTNTDHTTRTLLLPKTAPGLLVVTRGSTSNIDTGAAILSTGHSQIKAFNLTNMTGPYDFASDDGLLLGWGLRNDVGIDEHPMTGGIFSVENSVDQMERNNVDIHQTNPAEELNFLGFLNGKASTNQGRNFGYPECFTAWDPTSIPKFAGKVGEQFSIGSSANNSGCSAAERQEPRLAFHPHMAPLDILFNSAGTAAWVSFHGSWNSDPPFGYKVSMVEFDAMTGQPVAESTSTTAAMDIMANQDNTQCPEKCFRPVGLAWDSKGRLFMSSDESGEIYAILRSDGSSTNSANGSSSSTTGSSAMPSSSSGSGAGVATVSGLAVVFGLLSFLF